MAVTTGAMLAIGMGMSMVGQLAQGRATRKAMEAQALQDERLAAQQRDAAQQEADRIRRAGKKSQGAARAALAKSGVDVNAGTSLLIEDEIGAESEKDARMTLLTGRRQSDASLFSADQARARGRNAQRASQLGAISTGLQGWKGVSSAQTDTGYRYKVPDFPGAEY